MKVVNRVTALLRMLPRPLDPVRSIKLKLGIVVVGSGAAALAFFWWRIGWLPPTTSVMAIALALLTSQVLAHGMTLPLRQMTASAKAIARGDYEVRVRATARDEVGELATAFNQMGADLGAADQQRRDLIANVSHELRTPITALRAVLENIVDGVTPADPATMSTALAQTQRLGRLIEELLDLSRLDAGVLTLARERLPLAPLLADMVAEAEVAGRGTRFEVKVEPADAHAYADRGRLHQVVANLLDNASRHGPRNGLVRLLATEHADHTVIEVIDEGPGIAAADRHRVFERFTRGERSGDGGTGLGLAIAQWVVDLHGGTIAVVDPGRSGCRIRVTLPDA